VNTIITPGADWLETPETTVLKRTWEVTVLGALKFSSVQPLPLLLTRFHYFRGFVDEVCSKKCRSSLSILSVVMENDNVLVQNLRVGEVRVPPFVTVVVAFIAFIAFVAWQCVACVAFIALVVVRMVVVRIVRITFSTGVVNDFSTGRRPVS
jgi:hypothetical protein